MIHLKEDQLLEFALETNPDDSVRAEIETHLASCPDCRASLAKIKNDLDFIGSIRPRANIFPMPSPKRKESVMFAIIRTAALLILGAFVGIGIAGWSRTEPVCVMPAYNIAAAPADLGDRLVISEATAVQSLYSVGAASSGR